MQRNGGRIDINWVNGHIEHIYPGMPVKVIFLDKDKPKEIRGVIGYNHTVVNMEGTGVTNKGHKVNTLLSIFSETPDHTSRKSVEVLKTSPVPIKEM
jgi:hypothetical protein